MTYATGSKILASDLNAFKDTFNGLWSTGSGSYGYGQTAVSGVTAGNKIKASDWSPLIDNLRKVLLHQGTSFTAMTTPTAGTKATSLTSLVPNYVAAEGTSTRFNAASVGDTTTYRVTATSTASFNDTQTITITASFGSHDKARYFFNAGGQFDLSFSHPTAPLASIAAGLGNIRFGAGTQTIGGTTFTGTTKIGGSTNADSAVVTTDNFYNIPATNKYIAYQSTSTNNLPTMEIYAKYNQAGTITFTVLSYAWSGTQPASPPTIAAGSTVTVAARQPPTTYFTNSWAPITFTTNVTQTGVSTAQWYLFASSGSLVVPAGKTTARVILIAGGACGETATGLTIKGGGGGGAGQVRDTAAFSVTAGQTLTWTVGAGGQGFQGYAGDGTQTVLYGSTNLGAFGGTRGGSAATTDGAGGATYGGPYGVYGGGQAYIYNRIVYGGGGGAGAGYFGFNGAQSGTVFQGEGGVGGVGVTLGPINGSFYNVGGGGQGGMNLKLTNWTLTDETGYKYGGGLGGVNVADGFDGVAGTGGGGGGGAQTGTAGLEPLVGGNGGSGFVAIYM